MDERTPAQAQSILFEDLVYAVIVKLSAEFGVRGTLSGPAGSAQRLLPVMKGELSETVQYLEQLHFPESEPSPFTGSLSYFVETQQRRAVHESRKRANAQDSIQRSAARITSIWGELIARSLNAISG
jgi:hypothetical protein